MTRILTLMAILFATSAAAQTDPRCAYTAVAEYAITGRYGETVADSETRPGDDGADILWRVWVNEDTGSWTLTGSRGAVTCIFAGAMRGYAGQTVADFLDGPKA